MDLRETLTGAIVMGPMTEGTNLPYRRLAVELGARVLVSEMAVARRLKQKRKSEFALLRRFPGEPCFGVQLAGTNPDEMAWAAALAEVLGGPVLLRRRVGALGGTTAPLGCGRAGRHPSRGDQEARVPDHAVLRPHREALEVPAADDRLPGRRLGEPAVVAAAAGRAYELGVLFADPILATMKVTLVELSRQREKEKAGAEEAQSPG